MNQQPAQPVYELTGKLIDEHTRYERPELQALLTSSAEARRAYIEAMLLQADLYHLVNKARQEE